MSKELFVVPLDLKSANDWVTMFHRHHSPVVGHKFSLGCMKDNDIVGVVIVGRPVSRVRDNGWTLVDGIEQAFIPHGYASGQDRWVETIEDSRWIQGPWCFPIGCLDLPAGTVHPNETGHRAIANLTVPKLRRPAPTFALGETGGAAVQPGQAFELRLPVTNTSTEAGADDVRGTLVGSDPGLSLTQTSAFYPALAPGATATSTNAFTGTVASGTPCGTDLGLTVEVTAAPGDSYRRPLRWFDRVLQVGGTGPLLAGSTTGPGVPAVIPEGDVADGKTGPMSTASVLTVPLAVTGSGPVHDVSLKIDELRGAVGPLKLELVAPNKRKVTVFDGGDRVPRPLTTPKTPGTDMLGATFAKAGGALPVSGNAPLSGTYAVPELAAFDALEARGTWKLVVSNYGASPVTLKGWSAPTHVAVC